MPNTPLLTYPILAKAVDNHLCDIRERASDELTEAEREQRGRDTYELVRVLYRILHGVDPSLAFGAPGDWGYSTAMGKAVLAQLKAGASTAPNDRYNSSEDDADEIGQ